MSIFVRYLVTSLQLKKGDQLNKENFKVTHPKKIWIYYLYQFLPFVWMVMYLFIIFPGLPKLFHNGNLVIYFASYLLLGGISILDSILEILTKISPIRQGGRSLRLNCLVVNESIRLAGLIQLGLIGGVGLISWLLIFFGLKS